MEADAAGLFAMLAGDSAVLNPCVPYGKRMQELEVENPEPQTAVILMN